MKEYLLKKIENKEIVVGVVGLGYVGLPLAVEKAKAGFKTIGFDVQDEKVAMVNEGKNYIGDVVDSDLFALQGHVFFSLSQAATGCSVSSPLRMASANISAVRAPAAVMMSRLPA